MEMVGKLLFFGGAAGLAIFTAAGIVSWVILRRKKRTLLQTIETEYQ